MEHIGPEAFGVLLIGGIIVILGFWIYPITLVPRTIIRLPLKKPARFALAFLVGFIVFTSFYIATTRLIAETSFEVPLHGISSGVWDSADMEGGGDLFTDLYTGQTVNLDDTFLQELTKERFLRYLLPPFYRDICLSRLSLACQWANIDLENFDDRLERFDFALRLMLGLVASTAAGFIPLRYSVSIEKPEFSGAG